MKKIGLIAGNRQFPLLFCRKAKSQKPDLQIIAVAVKGEASKKISQLADKVYWVDIGSVKKLIEIFLAENVTTLVMAGQISPYRIFRDRKNWDDLMNNIVKSSPDFRPHSIFTEIIKEIQNNGLTFIDSVTFMEDSLAAAGINNNCYVSGELKEQITYYAEGIRNIVDLDIGQTVVCKDRAIVAVEALEGTDNTIRRAYRICGKGFVVVKLAKRGQDLRFDVPVVGLKTIKLLARLGAKALVLEKDKTLVLDKPRVLALADKANIPIIGV